MILARKNYYEFFKSLAKDATISPDDYKSVQELNVINLKGNCVK